MRCGSKDINSADFGTYSSLEPQGKWDSRNVFADTRTCLTGAQVQISPSLRASRKQEAMATGSYLEVRRLWLSVGVPQYIPTNARYQTL